MLPVKVTVAMGRRTVPVEEVRDARIAGALGQAGRDLGEKLAKVRCPEHGKGPTDVRLHFDTAGNGDLKYESCCAALGKEVGRVLG